jgi:hypothetical protein
MKKPILCFFACVMINTILAQGSLEEVMEKRAREFHKVLGLSDKELYKKFMKENYTKEYLEKPVKLNRVESDSDGGNSTEKDKSLDNDNKVEFIC